MIVLADSPQTQAFLDLLNAIALEQDEAEESA
jgi:hypothetical protein